MLWKKNFITEHYTANNSSWDFTDMNAFWSALNNRFKSPTDEYDAVQTLDSIRMGNKPAADFFAEWEDLATRAGMSANNGKKEKAETESDDK